MVRIVRVGVQRAEHEVTGLRRGERQRDGLEIAQLADRDHVGVFAQRGAQRAPEALRVRAHLALVHLARLRGVQHFDRILDGEDVVAAFLVHEVQERRHRRRLAAAGRTGHEHHALVVVGEPRERARQPQLFERRRVIGHGAEHAVESTLLAIEVGAEATDTVERVGEVELAVGVEERRLLLR